MMFMMPMPPTTSDTPATEPRIKRHADGNELSTSTTAGGVEDVEIVRVVVADAMPLPHQQLDLVFQVGYPIGGAGQHRDHHDVFERCLDAFHDGRNRGPARRRPRPGRRGSPLSPRARRATTKGMLPMRIVAPTQLEVWKRFFATVLPRTQTLAAARTSPGVKNSPFSICQLESVR